MDSAEELLGVARKSSKHRKTGDFSEWGTAWIPMKTLGAFLEKPGGVLTLVSALISAAGLLYTGKGTEGGGAHTGLQVTGRSECMMLLEICSHKYARTWLHFSGMSTQINIVLAMYLICGFHRIKSLRHYRVALALNCQLNFVH